MAYRYGKVKRELFLMHGQLRKNNTNYTGIILIDPQEMETALNWGQYTNLKKFENFSEEIALDPGQQIAKIYLVKHGWLVFTSASTFGITHRWIYPFSSYSSSSTNRLFWKIQNYMIMNIEFRNDNDKSILGVIQFRNDSIPTVTFSNHGSANEHTILLYPEMEIIRTNDLTPWLQ